MPLAATTVFRVFMLLASFPGTRKHVARLVKGAREWWSGRKIAVIGPTAAGKDSFLARLQGRQIPEVHSNSQAGEKVKSFRVKLALSHHQTIDITCKGVINIGGETDYRDAPSGWLEVCKGADVIFYVMTVTDLAEKRYLKGRRVRRISTGSYDAPAPQGGRTDSHPDLQDRRRDRVSHGLSGARWQAGRGAPRARQGGREGPPPLREPILRRDAHLDEEQEDLHARASRCPPFRLLRARRRPEAQGGVAAMRAYWILPNRDQGDVVLASDGERTVPLRQILDPELRPDGFSHGIPTEVLETCGPAGLDEVLFAQCFPAGSDGTRLASVFTPAGVDSSGRVVHLGLLYFLGPGERPDFALPYARLPPDDRAHASALISRMTDRGRGDPWAASVHELFGLPRLPGPATNVELTRSVTPFHALYALGRGGLTKISRSIAPRRSRQRSWSRRSSWSSASRSPYPRGTARSCREAARRRRTPQPAQEA